MSTHSLAALHLNVPPGTHLTKNERHILAHLSEPWEKLGRALGVTIGTAERCADRLFKKIDKANGKAQDTIGS